MLQLARVEAARLHKCRLFRDHALTRDLYSYECYDRTPVFLSGGGVSHVCV